ncbi:hypothetical protein DFS34DRAFT_678593 [Phlyctochytrium arcticum]|nr:hypothetical protein DFS34DRAFT_678593 [Phlyctochytrium arcticum]
MAASNDNFGTTYQFQNQEKYSLKELIAKFPLPSKKRSARAAFAHHFGTAVVEDNAIVHFALKRKKTSDLSWEPSIPLSTKDALVIDGKPLNLEAYGDRAPQGIRFKVTNVSTVFNAPTLTAVLTNVTSSFEKPRHFCKVAGHYYFTYLGFVKWIITSRQNKLADDVQEWMIETLFTAQLGTNQQKSKLIARMAGVTIRDVKALFSKCVDPISVVYLWRVGEVKDFRDRLKIESCHSDSAVLFKFGLSGDFSERGDGYDFDQQFGFPLVDCLRLETFATIDSAYLHKAEKILKDGVLFPFRLTLYGQTKQFDEFVCIPTKDCMTPVKDAFKFVSELCSGRVAGLKALNDRLQGQLELLRNDVNWREKEAVALKASMEQQLQQKESQIESKEREIKLHQDVHRLKIELLEAQLAELRKRG